MPETCPNQLTLFAEDIHAKICQQQGNNKVFMGRGRRFTRKCSVLLASVDQNTRFLKTSQGCLTEITGGGSQSFCMTWPLSGLMRNGTVYRRRSLEPTIVGKEYGLLLTPSAQQWRAWTFKNPFSLIRKRHSDGNLQERLMRVYQRMITPECVEHMMGFPPSWTDLER